MDYPGIGSGEAIYAVGDVHGCADLLDALLARIDADRAARADARATEVWLGDYIDRGSDSAGVLRRLMARRETVPSVVCLMGNHERMLVDAFDSGDRFDHWLSNGGDATLASFGLREPLFGMWRRSALAALPAAELAFVRNLPLAHRHGPYLFVHAGVRPNVPEAAQDPNDLLWIRDAFLDHADPMPGTVVIYGHTPVEEPEFRPGRIGIDTGAVFSGRLTCLRIDANGPAIL